MTMLYFLLPYGNICSLIRLFYKISYIFMIRRIVRKIVVTRIRPMGVAVFHLASGIILRALHIRFARPIFFFTYFKFLELKKLSYWLPLPFFNNFVCQEIFHPNDFDLIPRHFVNSQGCGSSPPFLPPL